ncbi:MAG: alpha/beta hydrolase [Spirochaetes bacterium]|nr:alpha/beta hydrolase [Spirochaetota bacterium]
MNLVKRFLNAVPALGMLNIPPETLIRRYANDQDKYFFYGGMKIRYRDEGDGPVLVLLHGVCAFLETWDGWVSVLKKHFRLVRLDVPGFGITGPAPDKSYYVREKFVRVMDGLITELGLRHFSIVGNSLGGYFAWNYALDYPEKVNKMILIDTVGYNQKMPFLLTFASNPLVRPIARFAMPRFMLYTAVKQVYGNKSRVMRENQERYFEYAMRTGNKGSYVDIFAEMKRQNKNPDLARDIPNIRVPTLVMWGTKDEWVPYRYFDSWKKDLPSARFIAYEGAGHVPMEEVPEQTAADALAFLKK